MASKSQVLLLCLLTLGLVLSHLLHKSLEAELLSPQNPSQTSNSYPRFLNP